MSGVPARVVRDELTHAVDRADRVLRLLNQHRVDSEHRDDEAGASYLMKIQAVTAHLSAAEIAAYDL